MNFAQLQEDLCGGTLDRNFQKMIEVASAGLFNKLHSGRFQKIIFNCTSMLSVKSFNNLRGVEIFFEGDPFKMLLNTGILEYLDLSHEIWEFAISFSRFLKDYVI